MIHDQEKKTKERENPGDKACNMQTLTYVWVWWLFQILNVKTQIGPKRKFYPSWNSIS